MKGDSPENPEKSRFDAVMQVLCLLAPVALAAQGVQAVPPASHDEAVVRTVGLGYTGIFRALDVLVAAPAMLLPVGTRALRAGLASAVVAGVASALAYEIARRLVAGVLPSVLKGAPPSPKLGSAVAMLAVLGATLAPRWQDEAAAPGGAVTGALLVVVALVLAGNVHITGIALALGLAASYDPWVLLAAGLGVAPLLVAARPDRSTLLDAGAAFALGLAPFALGFALSRRAPELALGGGPEAPARASIVALASSELGPLLLGAAALGLGLAAWVPATRMRALSLAGVVAAGALSVILGARSGGSVLAALLAALILAGVALAGVALAIARAPVPFAQASAALVVVLELVLPVRSADETLARREARMPRGGATWTELAWGPAPPGAAVLVADRTTMRRVSASRALGDLRADLVFVPTFDIRGPAARRALATEPKLAPLYRDVSLGSPPEELSLAQLAGVRPLLTAFDPRWEKGLARHLLPIGLTARFEPEPRGPSDRKKAFDAFAPSKDRLVRVASSKRDTDLAAATAAALRSRAVAMAACSDRDALSRALDDLRPFTEDDKVVDALVRRMVTSKGAIDVHDLGP